jgi:hypothetical protein
VYPTTGYPSVNGHPSPGGLPGSISPPPTIRPAPASNRSLRAALRWAIRFIERDAATDGLSRRWAWSVFWLPIVGGALVLSTDLLGYFYYWLLLEDHPVEWSQFALLLLTTSVSAAVAVSAARRRDWLMLLVAAGLALGSFAVCGEEISWGQRVFGFGTPGALHEVNAQGEMNLHDIKIGFDLEDAINFAEMLFSLAVCFLPLLTRSAKPLLRGRLWRLISPPSYTVTAFGGMFAYRFLRFFVLSHDIDGVIVFKQWMEVGFYVSMLAMAISLSGQLRLAYAPRHRRAGAVAGAGGPASTSGVDLTLILMLAAGSALVTIIFAIMSLFSGVSASN